MDFMGLDHVVFTTSNLERAISFYHGLLGMPILHAMEYQELDDDGTVSSSAQHFYFGVGGDNPEAHIAIFAFRDSVSESGVPRDIRQPGAFLHFNLRVNPDRIEEYCRQLRDADYRFKQVTRYPIDASNAPTRETQPGEQLTWRIKTTRNAYHEPEKGWLMNSVYLSDPDGVRLEFNAWSDAWAGLWPPEAVIPWGAAGLPSSPVAP
jgi:catechol 2,3-dioxygenase-like lactoylglutathione lyase family enzyme